jgi:hypothetical protein
MLCTPHASGVQNKTNHEIIQALQTLTDSQAFVTSCNDETQLCLFTVFTAQTTANCAKISLVCSYWFPKGPAL